VAATAMTAVAATLLHPQAFAAAPSDWLVLALLALCAACAHMFPVRSASNGAVYPMTNVFVIAGAVLLPPGLAALLPVLALTPDSWRSRRSPGALIRWTFNISQTALAAYAAGSLVRWAGVRELHGIPELAVVVVAAALFVVAQAAMVGVAIASNSRISFRRTGVFDPPALLGEYLKGLLAVVVAGLWWAEPVLLVIVPGVLLVAHRMTRTAHLAHLAEVDAKTGLHTSRYFERVLEEELAHSLRVRRPLAILFADLDHFKQVNDRYGHDAGDRVLRAVSTRLTSVLRKNDVLARFGGEEFVVLLPGTESAEAMYLAERLRSAVQHHAFELDDGTQLHRSISIGVAVCPDDGSDAAALIKQADRAMYRAKQTRNAVARAHVEAVPVVQAPTGVKLAAPQPRQSSQQIGLRQRLEAVLLWGAVLAGLYISGWSVLTIARLDAWDVVLPLLCAAVIAELLKVRIYQVQLQTLSFSFGIVVTMAAATAHTYAAALVGLAGALVYLGTSRPRGTAKILFNLVNPALAGGAAGWLYRVIAPHQSAFTAWHLLAALAAVLAHVAINLGLIALLVSFRSGRPVTTVLRQSGWSIPTNILLGLTGAFLGIAHDELGPLGTAMFALPVLWMRFTLAFYASRSQTTIQTLELQAEQLEHQALYDALTDLPNRRLLQDRLQAILEQRIVEPVALLMLDLDRFKEINDTFGHDHGDVVLRETGTRLRSVLRESDTLARLGGDEFAILLPAASLDDARSFGGALLQACQEPLSVAGCSVDVGASIGIAVGPTHGGDAATLLRRAEVAMYKAKQERSGCAVYSPDHDQYSPDRLTLVSELRYAIEHDQLTLHYQPQVGTATGRVAAVEALLRWRHPLRGNIPPDQFIPLAEHTGLIKPLTYWVLDSALRQCRAWLDGGQELSVAVNASMYDLHDATLPDTIATLLTIRRVPAHCLRLEITEGAIMADPDRALDVLGRLRELGVSIAVDDFGTGYSSLAYLKRLPVNELKIDRSFVRDMVGDRDDQAIVRSTISLGHELGLRVVAEGVENQATWQLLERFGCDLVQGYVVSRPLPAADLALWLQTYTWPRGDALAAA